MRCGCVRRSRSRKSPRRAALRRKRSGGKASRCWPRSPPGAFAVALDLGGAAPDSAGLAALLERWEAGGRAPHFLIGGAEGLDAAVLARADHVLSLGPLTWPHMLVRVMLAEQLYRAQAIRSGHPYHRAGRP